MPRGISATDGRVGAREERGAVRDELTALLDAAPGIHVVTDGDGVIVDARGADVDLLAARPQLLRGKSLAQYVTPASRSRLEELAEGAPAAAVDFRARGRTFSATVSASRGSGSRVCWTLVRGGGDAISDLARAEQLRGVFERLHQGIVVVDRTLRVTVANGAARRFLNAPLGAGTLLPAGGGLELGEIAERAFGASSIEEATIAHAQKVYRVVSIPPERAGDAAVIVITDRSEQERQERVERDFVSYASHELRTPLATISGAIEILQAGAKEVPDARDRFLRHIEREVTRLGRLVATLLVLARVQAGHELPEVAPVRVRPVLEGVAARLSVAPAVDVVVACESGVAVVAHHDLLVEIMVNLAANAAKYTEQGKIVFAAVPDGEAVAIEVRDTGRGIPLEAQDMLFERFFRADDRKSDGFGLGLAIVREAVTALGGSVEVQSAPGSGTTVRVVLPVADRSDVA